MAASSSQVTTFVDDNLSSDDNLDPIMHLPLYKAALKGDWEIASRIFEQNPKAATAKIMGSMYALHVAIGTRKSNEFVEKLIERMSAEEVATMTNGFGDTAISMAAAVGNTDGVKLLVRKNPDLPNIQGMDGRYPIHKAAHFGHRETVLYLLEVTKAGVQPSPYEKDSGVLLLRQLILAGFYDLAANLVQQDPELARFEGFNLESPLCCIAIMRSAFYSSSEFTLQDRLIYSCVPLTSRSEIVANKSSRGDIENTANISQAPICSWFQHLRGINCTALVYLKNFMSLLLRNFRLRLLSVILQKPTKPSTLRQKLLIALWKVIERLVPRATHIHEMKLIHGDALRVVELLCIHAADFDPSRAVNIFRNPMFVAAKHGVSEIVEKIIESFPIAVQFVDHEHRNIFQLAILFRHHKVFNLISRISHEHKLIVAENLDHSNNTIFHLVGNLAPPDQLNRVSGAALQMQRELQWFKEVEKVVPDIYRDSKNHERKTPRMVFTKEHKELVKEGERWMKDTSNSCSVVATLIATVVFAAAITVPGGTNGDSGLPVFKSQKAFVIFAVSDALSLFSSTAAILMFLSILIARYAEDDFLQALPKRMIMGAPNPFHLH